MNLTLIKNFFLSDRKSMEQSKVGRVLRRSFRVKRSKHVLEGNREKRKSGKTLFDVWNFVSRSTERKFWRNSDAIIAEDDHPLDVYIFAHESLSLYAIIFTSLPADSFVNSQEWTISRAVPDLRLGIVGSLNSGKSALVHRYLTGSYMQEESPEGGRFKKEIQIDNQSYLLLIRDEGGAPEMQVSVLVLATAVCQLFCCLLALCLIHRNNW